jgi:glucose-1-phosphate cytidylyltransferase
VGAIGIKVVILCGGQGTRLKEETEFRPKPLVEIGGMPIIWHIMKIYSRYGYKEFVLPLGYKGEMIKEYFLHFDWRANDFTLDIAKHKINVHTNHKKDDWVIHFVDTGLESKTALRLYKVKHLLEGQDFMLTYGDGVADIDISELVKFHKKSKRIATITGVNVASKFGVINTKGSKVTSFEEKPCEANFINGGFMVFSPNVFDYLTDEDIMLEADESLLTRLAKIGQVSVYTHPGFWHSMDTYRDYLSLNELWKQNPRWKIW